MELAWKIVPFAIAGWNAAMAKILKIKKVHSERIVNAIAYYSYAISLFGYFDVGFVKELIELKGAA